MLVLQRGVADRTRTDQPAIGAVAYSPDGTRLATVGHYVEPYPGSSSKWQAVNQFIIWDAANGVELFSDEFFWGGSRCVRFLPSGKEVAFTTGRSELQIREA